MLPSLLPLLVTATETENASHDHFGVPGLPSASRFNLWHTRSHQRWYLLHTLFLISPLCICLSFWVPCYLVVEARDKQQGVPRVVERWGEPESFKSVTAVSMIDRISHPVCFCFFFPSFCFRFLLVDFSSVLVFFVIFLSLELNFKCP